MKQIIDFLKKNYVYVNITFLFLAIYVILFPIISSFIQIFIPQFGVCPYLRVTGKPCPLCGGTRYIQNFHNVFTDITYLFHPFGIMVIVIVLELIYRIYCLITRKKERSNRTIEIDFVIHLLIIICFCLYEIIFLIIQQNS